MTGVEVSRGWSNYLKTPWVNNVKSDTEYTVKSDEDR